MGLRPGHAGVEVVLVSPPLCPLGGDGTSLALLGLCVRRSGRDKLKMKERIDISLRKPRIFKKAGWLLEASFGNPFLPPCGAPRHEGVIQRLWWLPED